ncbi:MAG: hypothetical protein AB7L92_06795 [Alphaproteobacteria bacterium]
MRHSTILLLVFMMAAQGLFWQHTRNIKPDMGIVPDVPGKQAIHALTFGDDEFFFRILAMNIQNAGDTYGRFTSLRYYDFSKLYLWFNLLDTLDARSDMIPAMASYYFSQTQNTADIRYVVDYLYAHATRDVAQKWWWLLQSIYLASHRLEDMDLALKVAKPMMNPAVPVFAQQMVAVVHEKRGEMEDAYHIMETIRENIDDIPESDIKYMIYFIKERLQRLDEVSKYENMLQEKSKQE